jgi:hypothetical protein
MNRGQPDLGPEGGGAGAAQATDYLEVVHTALAGRGRNTPEARHDVYARVREVVHRHLGLSGMAKPLADLERLALDLAIRNVEQQWRARGSAELVARDARVQRPPSRIADLGPAGPAPAQGNSAQSDVPQRASPPRTPQRAMVRMLLSPIGVAVALPIAGAVILVVYLLGNDISFWGAEEPRQMGLAGQMSTGATSQPPQSVAPPAKPADAASDRPTRVRPVRADFAAKP